MISHTSSFSFCNMLSSTGRLFFVTRLGLNLIDYTGVRTGRDQIGKISATAKLHTLLGMKLEWTDFSTKEQQNVGVTSSMNTIWIVSL